MLKNIAIFTAGVVIGSAVALKYAEEKYRKIADEEIASVKEVFSKRENNKKDNDEKELSEERKRYEEITEKYKSDNEDEQEQEDEKMKPFVIPPDEFGECDYETISLTLYSDGVLTDMQNNEIEDVEGMVGEESLNHFGEYEEDTVYVRNHEREEDYEICLDERNFSESLSNY